MHVVVVEWLSVRETGADELNKQLTVEENHGCSLQLETMPQSELIVVIYVLLWNDLKGRNRNVAEVVEEENNRNVVVMVEGENLEMWWW